MKKQQKESRYSDSIHKTDFMEVTVSNIPLIKGGAVVFSITDFRFPAARSLVALNPQQVARLAKKLNGWLTRK